MKNIIKITLIFLLLSFSHLLYASFEFRGGVYSGSLTGPNTAFLSFKEGYELAKEIVKPYHESIVLTDYPNFPPFLSRYTDSFEIKDPVLIFAYAAISTGLEMWGYNGYPFAAVDTVSLEENNMGQALIWYYVFAERNDLSKMKMSLVIKPSIAWFDTLIARWCFLDWEDSYDIDNPTWGNPRSSDYFIPPSPRKLMSQNGVTAHPIELSDIEEDSDEFFRRVYENSEFRASLWNNVLMYYKSNQSPFLLFIGTVDSACSSAYGMEQNKPVWMAKAGQYVIYAYEDIIKNEKPKKPHICYEYLDNDEISCYDVLGIYEYMELTTQKVYPNPGYYVISIDFTLPDYCENVRMYIQNPLGQVVLVPIENIAFEGGDHTELINVDSLPVGVYYIIIEAGAYLSAQPINVIR